MAEPLKAVDGWIELSDAPGIGYAVDQEAIDTYRVG